MAAKWKLAAGKTWRSKLEERHENHGKIVELSASQRKRLRARTMLIPDPRELDALIRRVRKGELVTQGSLRNELADVAGAELTCPMTTGIFLRIVAEAAEEARAEGRKRVTPYWRVIKDDGALNPRFPGGVAAHARQLRAEGHHVASARARGPLRVADWADSLCSRIGDD